MLAWFPVPQGGCSATAPDLQTAQGKTGLESPALVPDRPASACEYSCQECTTARRCDAAPHPSIVVGEVQPTGVRRLRSGQSQLRRRSYHTWHAAPVRAIVFRTYAVARLCANVACSNPANSALGPARNCWMAGRMISSLVSNQLVPLVIR